jgi:hypothetical protein
MSKFLHRISEKTKALSAKIRARLHRVPLPLRIILAAAFFVLGVLGLFLPVLQGGLFLFIALWLLFPKESERWLERMTEWFSKLRNR